MKLITKNGHKFISGMLWQIPDEGKKRINLKKLAKDTGSSMYCQLQQIRPTWGFCRKTVLQGEKNVASLGKFIIEASKLNSEYANSIICYKFKDEGELGEAGEVLKARLYGYIILLNRTICPDEGEYVAEFEAVYESIINKAKLYPIDTLYLPLDSSSRFFNLYERLDDAYSNEQLLINILNNASMIELKQLKSFISDKLPSYNLEPFHAEQFSLADVLWVRQIIKSPEFTQKIKSSKDKIIKYLIPNIYHLPFTSDEVYWNNTNFRYNVNKSKLKEFNNSSVIKFKFILLLILLTFCSYLIYDLVVEKPSVIQPKMSPKVIPRPVTVNPGQLISICLTRNDHYFKDLNPWMLTALKCNSLGNTLIFTASNEQTLADFIHLTNTSRNVSLNGRTAILKQTNNLPLRHLIKPNQQDVLQRLQQAGVFYHFKLTTLPASINPTKFVLTSELSPLFLEQHAVFADVALSEINMTLDSGSGLYTWTIQGEF